MMRTLDAGRLARSCAVSRRRRRCPFVFSGVKIAAAIAVIGAVFGEWAGADSGLGHLILGRAEPARDRPRVRGGRGPRRRSRSLLFAALGADRAAGRLVGRASETAATRTGVAARAPLAAGCGEKPAAAAPARRGPADRPRARLLRQPRPRRHLRGARRGATSPTRASTSSPRSPPTPRRRSARWQRAVRTWPSPTSPRCSSRRTRGLPVKAVAALVDRPLTSLISLPEAGIAASPTSRARRSPPPGSPTRQAYLDAILARAGLASSGTSTQVDVGWDCCPRCSRAGPTRCSAAS